ncbi:MAG: beta-galactosidase, partial [Candidatus Eremiobacteraeota bacterium]|nr:beta-galactosidase [Candidatus Eremiobacteraeota bacterium]
FIVRPGPMIRNEWRNGGYPAWLLTRPEYGMPLHDVLEGRYPATATLQNAHSDDAAAEWMRNRTHLHYASRWLHRALAEFRPYADRVLAVQLDDDQGAYIDNQTYPAPNLERYLRWLEAQARDVVGPATPTFINTYEMRVPASVPVWTMGNWYQSDAYAIAEHDRVALDLATAMLRTNRRGPLAESEFQAGWLAQPEDPEPRAADPSNTTLALYELLAWGVHGVIDFPMQDSLAPFGWEAPFSNAFYGWDAALRYPNLEYCSCYDGAPPSWRGSRYGSTHDFGRLVERFGALLAETRRVADVALAYPGSSYPGDPARGEAALERFQEHLRACATRGTTCEVVDLAYAGTAALRSYRTLVVGDDTTRRRHAAVLRAFTRQGGTLATDVPAEHAPGTLLRGTDASFLVAVNWTDVPQTNASTRVRVGGHTFEVPAFDVPARTGRLVVIDLNLHRLNPAFPTDARVTTSCAIERVTAQGSIDGAAFIAPDHASCEIHGTSAGRSFDKTLPQFSRAYLANDGTLGESQRDCCTDMFVFGEKRQRALLAPSASVPLDDLHAPTSDATETYRADVFEDGARDVVLQNAHARVVIVPDGGARAVVFAPLSPPNSMGANVFDATGALRDDVLMQPPPSLTDRIARYTHSYAAGMFNRSYRVTQTSAESVRFEADVPDVVPAGAHFERIITLVPGTTRLVVDERAIFRPGSGADRQRAVVLSALATAPDASGQPTRTLYAGDTPIASAGTLSAPGGVALLSGTGGSMWDVLAISWRPGDVESASWQPQRSNGTLRMVLAPGWRRVTYALGHVDSREQALAFAEAERDWVASNPAAGGR